MHLNNRNSAVTFRAIIPSLLSLSLDEWRAFWQCSSIAVGGIQTGVNLECVDMTAVPREPHTLLVVHMTNQLQVLWNQRRACVATDKSPHNRGQPMTAKMTSQNVDFKRRPCRWPAASEPSLSGGQQWLSACRPADFDLTRDSFIASAPVTTRVEASMSEVRGKAARTLESEGAESRLWWLHGERDEFMIWTEVGSDFWTIDKRTPSRASADDRRSCTYSHRERARELPYVSDEWWADRAPF